MKIPASSACLALLLAGSAPLALAANRPPLSAPPTEVLQFDHDKVDAIFIKGGALQLNTKYKAYATRRDVPGAVEIHMLDTDLMYIVDGEVTFVTGGTPVDQKPIGPNEFHATSITGGVEHHLVAGDVIIVPHGIPHQFTKIEKPMRYLLIKVKE